jgi:hypothetical protein
MMFHESIHWLPISVGSSFAGQGLCRKHSYGAGFVNILEDDAVWGSQGCRKIRTKVDYKESEHSCLNKSQSFTQFLNLSQFADLEPIDWMGEQLSRRKDHSALWEEYTTTIPWPLPQGTYLDVGEGNKQSHLGLMDTES